jgi:hypothetical protein
VSGREASTAANIPPAKKSAPLLRKPGIKIFSPHLQLREQCLPQPGPDPDFGPTAAPEPIDFKSLTALSRLSHGNLKRYKTPPPASFARRQPAFGLMNRH